MYICICFYALYILMYISSIYFCVHSLCFDVNNVYFDVYFGIYIDADQYNVI